MNKKAVELNVATIIIVILAILVLVILALYFTGGMTKLWQKITPVAPSYDIGEVARAKQFCVSLCISNDRIGYCDYVAPLPKKDASGNIVGTDNKHCYDDPINAQKEVECKNVGFGGEDFCRPAT